MTALSGLQKERTIGAILGWQKAKLWQLSVTPTIAGNEELENLMHSFQLSQKEAKKPNVILKHLHEHFMASEGDLMDKSKFVQMKQEDQESGRFPFDQNFWCEFPEIS